MKIWSKEELEEIRRMYPNGCTVELVSMDDPQAPPSGTKGKVFCTDDAATIHIHWENGSSLGAVYGEDIIKKCI